MDKVDTVILSTLKGLGCEVEEDATKIEDLSSKTVLLAVARCLNTIDPSHSYPTDTVPKQMSAAVSLCTKICDSIKELGYRGSVGYHQLLYSTPVENRRLLSWLITQLPSNESEEASGQVGDASVWLAMEDCLAKQVQEIWKVRVSTRHVDCFTSRALHDTSYQSVYLELPSSGAAPRARHGIIEAYLRDYSKPVSGQPHLRSQVLPSLLESNATVKLLAQDKDQEWNTVGLDSGLNPFDFRKRKQERITDGMANLIRASTTGVNNFRIRNSFSNVLLPGGGSGRLSKGKKKDKSSRFRHQMEFSKDQDKKRNQEEVEKEKEEERAREVEAADERVNKMQSQIETANKKIANMRTNLQQIEPSIQKEKERMELLKQKLVNLRKTNELLPNAEENIKKLRDIADKNAANLMKLAVQWEEVRYPLVMKLREIKESLLGRKSNAQSQLEQVRKMRAEMKLLRADIESKDDQLSRVTDVLQRYKTDMTRELFTYTIDEIVKQVKKQQVEIDKILLDTRVLQKSRNSTAATLTRSFAITSDMLFKDAKKGDNLIRQSFKALASLHRMYEKMGATVEETGASSNQNMNLCQRIQQLEARTKTMDLDGLLNDLNAMKAENEKMVADGHTLDDDEGEDTLMVKAVVASSRVALTVAKGKSPARVEEADSGTVDDNGTEQEDRKKSLEAEEAKERREQVLRDEKERAEKKLKAEQAASQKEAEEKKSREREREEEEKRREESRKKEKQKEVEEDEGSEDDIENVENPLG